MEKFEDPSLIKDKKVEKTFEHPDSLVREAFIQFCYKTGPNELKTIDYLVKAIKGKIDIYGRFGLYEVTDKKAFKYLLNKFAADKDFLEKFMDRESIFNTAKEKADRVLIDRIEKLTDDKELLKLLKNIIRTAFSSDAHISYTAEKSYFINSITSFIGKKDPEYIFEVINEIGKEKDAAKRQRMLFNYINVFIYLININNLISFTDKISNLDERGKRIAQMVIERAKYLRLKEGRQIVNFAVSKKILPEPVEDKNFEKEKTSHNKSIMAEFGRLLEPEPGKYFPEVFEFYLNNKTLIDQIKSDKERKRLIKLAEEGLEKIDPRKIQLTINNLGSENKNYRITNVTHYFGNILRVGQLLFPKKLIKYRQKIIDFIPFSYYNDEKTIFEIIPNITDKELDQFVNLIYLKKENNHVRYFLPNTYIELINRYLDKGIKLKSYVRVIKSFINDQFISEYDQRQALTLLGMNDEQKIDKKELLDLFRKNKDQKIIETANANLIKLYKDKDAINWRFEELKKRLSPFVPPVMGEAHQVSPLEDEMDSLSFARPLIELNNIKYLPKFFNLLEFSFEKLKEPESKNLRPYVYYIWKIVTAFVNNLKSQGSFEPVNKLKQWMSQQDKKKGLNWLSKKVEELEKSYIDAMVMDKKTDEIISLIESI